MDIKITCILLLPYIILHWNIPSCATYGKQKEKLNEEIQKETNSKHVIYIFLPCVTCSVLTLLFSPPALNIEHARTCSSPLF